MKKILFFLVLFSASSVLAQSAKVLVCAPGNISVAKTTDTSLQKVYHDKIDLSDTLTDAINNYEVVFLISTNHRIDSTEEIILKKFLHLNNKLYMEYSGYSIKYPSYGKLDSNGFWHYVGIDFIGIDAVNFGIQSINGVSGTFADGMRVTNKTYEPTDDNFGTWDLEGNIKRVLLPSPDPSIDVADTYETDSFKVVLHFPTLDEYYYTEFLGRVVCNYFGLCAPLSMKSSEENPQIKFSFFPNPARDVIHIRSNTENSGMQSAVLISETGSLVSTFLLDGNMSHVDLDLGSLKLSSGSYFLQLTTQNESFLQPVLLYSK